MRPAWLHLSDSQEVTGDVLERAFKMRVGGVILPQPHFGAARTIKRYFTDRGLSAPTVVGRFYGSDNFNTWDVPFLNLPVVRAFGAWCADYMNNRDAEGDEGRPYHESIDIVQWANEPSIEWKYPNGQPWQGTVQGWKEYWQASHAWIAGYRYRNGVPLAGLVPHSPGQREDDDRNETTGEVWGYKGAELSEGIADLYDVALFHTYWMRGHHLDPYWGIRAIRLVDAYKWRKRWLIAETNRPDVASDEDRKAAAFEWREIIRTLQSIPGFMGIAWFIDQSPNPQFDSMQVIKNPWLIDIAREVNHTMPITPTVMYLNPAPAAYSGQPFHFSGYGTGWETLNLVFATLRSPRRDDGYAYIVDPYIEIKVSDDGRFEGVMQVPEFPADMPDGLQGSLSLTSSEGNADMSYDGASQSWPISFNRAVAQEPTPPVLPGGGDADARHRLWHALNVVFYAAGDASKLMKDPKRALYIQEEINVIKTEEGFK